MSNPAMKKIMGAGVSINAAIWEGYGKSVLCIHGITGNCRCWDTIAQVLSPKHRIVAMDLRGRGLSDKPSSGYSVGNHCMDILAVLEELGSSRYVLMGHSLGAIIALAFTAQHRTLVERIILIDAGGRLSEEQRNRAFSGIKPSLDRLGRVFPSTEGYLEFMKEVPQLHPWSSALETYFRYDSEKTNRGVRSRIHPEHIQEERKNLKKVDARCLYPRVTCPVLILRATEGMLHGDDILIPDEVLKKTLLGLPDARCVDIPGVNHFSIIFQSNYERDQAILKFLE